MTEYRRFIKTKPFMIRCLVLIPLCIIGFLALFLPDAPADFRWMALWLAVLAGVGFGIVLALLLCSTTEFIQRLVDRDLSRTEVKRVAIGVIVVLLLLTIITINPPLGILVWIVYILGAMIFSLARWIVHRFKGPGKQRHAEQQAGG